RLAPRLNALGRMQEARGGVQLMVSQEPDEAWALAQLMNQENSRRQALERQMIHEIEELWKADPALEKGKSLVLSSEDWPRGILGLVASRLVERWARPVFLFTIEGDSAHGSGRSVEGLHLFKGLESLESYLLGYGGHAAAAGASLRTENLPAFAQAFESLARASIGEMVPEPTLIIEGEIGFHQLMKEVAPHLPRLSPFGAENPEPLLATRGIRVKSVRIVGQGHLRLRLEQDGLFMDGIGFGMGDQAINPGGSIDLAYTPYLSNGNGRAFLELRLRDIKKGD
ncbi:MAG TPA: DHHA1 domain-containing protein, partial [Thermodesulfobacteriota bacterium]|nr:DHHA1 domain-containing protein [Thermodesulfobacteriota bacterium]